MGSPLSSTSGLANTDAAHLSTAVELVSTRHEQAPVPLDRRSRRRGVGSRSETRPGQSVRYDLLITGGASSIPLSGSTESATSRFPAAASPVEAEIVADAGDVIDARGKLVVPGLIDIHTHTGRSADGPGLVLQDGVTGWIDAGSQGADHIADPIAVARAAPQQAESSSTSAGWASSPRRRHAGPRPRRRRRSARCDCSRHDRGVKAGSRATWRVRMTTKSFAGRRTWPPRSASR